MHKTFQFDLTACLWMQSSVLNVKDSGNNASIVVDGPHTTLPTLPGSLPKNGNGTGDDVLNNNTRSMQCAGRYLPGRPVFMEQPAGDF